eukprot:5485448-Ditylum_brightwellii.AAC.1
MHEALDLHARANPHFPTNILRLHQLDLFMFFQEAKTSSHGLHQPSFHELWRHILTQTLPDMPLPPTLHPIFSSPRQRQPYQPHQQTHHQQDQPASTKTTWQGDLATQFPGYFVLKPIINAAKAAGQPPPLIDDRNNFCL